MNITDLEKSMINKIARNEYNARNGAIPRNSEDTTTWSNLIIESRQDKGVFLSLTKKGLVWFQDNGSVEENYCGLTDDGFTAYISALTPKILNTGGTD